MTRIMLRERIRAGIGLTTGLDPIAVHDGGPAHQPIKWRVSYALAACQADARWQAWSHKQCSRVDFVHPRTFDLNAMAHVPSNPTALTDDQREYCRTHITEFASLANSEREAWIADVIRHVWLLENEGYNWTELGKPDEKDETMTYGWTLTVRT